MSEETKASNPKEAFGDKRVPVNLVPETAIAEEAMAFLEGALKYGQYNWRIAGVRASTYIRAARRHLSKFANGQDRDPETLVHELASVRACCGIIIDAMTCGKLTDDRPPKAPIGAQYTALEKNVAHLKKMFEGHNPPQYTELEHGESRTEQVARGIQDQTGWKQCPMVQMGNVAERDLFCCLVEGHVGDHHYKQLGN